MGTIQKMASLFKDSLDGLGASIPSIEIEKLAIMIDKSMSPATRSYHNAHHVFSLTDGSDPLLSLAALYHDVVYFQVDRGFSPEITPIITPYIQQKELEFHIADQINPNDRMVNITLHIFGFEPGQKLLPSAGMNEFLSAIVLNKSLEGILSDKELVKITICIEATIPFVGISEDGRTHTDVLLSKLQQLNEQYGFGMSSDEIDEVMQLAVVFSNKDVDSFADADTGRFLDSTWKLLPETHAVLRSHEMYSITDYRKAMESMERFMHFLKPDIIYKSYKGVPSADIVDSMEQQADNNIMAAREYLGVKLLSIAIMEALAVLTGGDAPIALFMGDLERRRSTPNAQRLENFLPPTPPFDADDKSQIVYHLLSSGRDSESNFDLKNSPISLFLYKVFTLNQIQEYLKAAKQMFKNKLSPVDFLNTIDEETITHIIQASASVAITRKERLLSLIQPESDPN
jgi:hypothetical protein